MSAGTPGPGGSGGPRPRGGGVFQTFGFLFDVVDLATPVITRMGRALSHLHAGIVSTLRRVGTSLDRTLLAVGAHAGRVVAAIRPIAGVFASAAWRATGSIMNTLVGNLTRVRGAAYYAWASLRTLPTALRAIYSSMQHVGARVIPVLNRGIVGLVRAVRYGLGGALTVVRTVAGGALATVSGLLRIGARVGGFAAGGLVSLVLGPIGLIVKLLSPIVRIIARVLSPAFERLSGIIENAFAPLGYVADSLVQSWAPHIEKFMAGLVGSLTMAVAQVGIFLQDSKASGPVWETLRSAVSWVSEAILDIVKFALENVPTIVAGVVELGKAIWPAVEGLWAVVKALGNSVLIPTLKKLVEYAPEIKIFFEAFRMGMEKIAEKVRVMDWANAWMDFVGSIRDLTTFTWDKVVAGIKSVKDAIVDLVSVEASKGLSGGFGAAALGSVPLLGPVISAVRGGLPKKAEGGIATRETAAIVGERGPEAILPLTSNAIERTIAPVVAKLTLPEAREAVGLLQRAVGFLGEIAAATKQDRHGEMDLMSAVGTEGLA